MKTSLNVDCKEDLSVCGALTRVTDDDVHWSACGAVSTVSLALALIDGARAFVDVVVTCHDKKPTVRLQYMQNLCNLPSTFSFVKKVLHSRV